MENMNFFNPTDEFIDKLIDVIGDRMVVEIGCGRGALLQSLIEKGISALGIDPYVDLEELPLEIKGKVLTIEIEESITLISKIKEKEIVFIVARPCHSGFPQDYINMFGNKSEMIYIGFVKNIEVDFHRELSLIRIVKFPDHKDCDTVVILKEGYYNEEAKKSSQWDIIDKRVREIKGDVDLEIIKWFVEGEDIDIDPEKLKALFPEHERMGGGSRSGGDWEEYEGCSLLSRDVTGKRVVGLDIATYMVGGGHFSCSIDVEDEYFIKQCNDDDHLSECRPWDKIERRPEWVNGYDNLVWFGLRDSKRTSSLESGLIWLKESFIVFEKQYKDIGIDLVIRLGSGLRYELDELKGI